MAGGIGLSRVLQGAVEGVDRGMQRRDRATQRERADEQYEQGQEDREYSLSRRALDDARQDKEYQRKTEERERNDAVNRAMNALMRGDVSLTNEVFNRYSEEGLSIDLQPNDKGTYTHVMDYKGKKTDPKELSIDDIGKGLISFKSDDNPFVRRAAQAKIDREDKQMGAKRAHEIAKIVKEYELKRGLKSAPEGKDGKASAARSKANLSINKELNDLAKEDYGTLFGDQWKFDTTRDKALRSAQADLASAYYFSSDDADPSTNRASRSALQDMRKFLSGATRQADAELDEGSIDKNQYDNRVADIIEFYTDDAINKMAPSPGEVLQRGGGEPAPKSEAGTNIPPEAIQQLKADDSEEMRKFFDNTFGPGSANSVLNGGHIDEGDTAEAGVSDNSGPGLARKDKADDKPKVKKEKYSGQKKRAEMRKDLKARGRTAVSEFKNEWKNLSDEEKIKWFSENASALKYKSQSSHRKAKKEIATIRSKKHFSKQSKEGFESGKKDYELKRN